MPGELAKTVAIVHERLAFERCDRSPPPTGRQPHATMHGGAEGAWRRGLLREVNLSMRFARWSDRGLTLVELLIAIAIVGVLISLLIPGLAATTRAARSFKCQMGLRAVAFDFSIFADDQLHGDRGNDELLDGDRFRVETFQETQYRIDEFWAWGSTNLVTMPDERGNDPMRCPENPGPLELRRAAPCSEGGVGPPKNVSYGFNVRLHLAEVERSGRVQFRRVQLQSLIADQGRVPLAWDIDGTLAQQRGLSGVYSGPSLDSRLIFADDRYWFPSRRHGSSINLAFIDGRVESTSTPLAESSWDWGYQPIR